MNYHKEYYEKNKDQIALRKKERYQSDPFYRENILRRARLRKNIKKAERKAVRVEKLIQSAKDWDPLLPKVIKIKVLDVEREVPMYSIGQFAAILSRKTQTIRLWERQGKLPPAPFRSASDNRLYPEFLVKLYVAAFTVVVEKYGKLKLFEFTKLAFRIHSLYPTGLEI